MGQQILPKSVSVPLKLSICFVYVLLVFGMGFYYSILVEIDDIFVE